jgi:DNA-binding CsgD family transcriptional regulator
MTEKVHPLITKKDIEMIHLIAEGKTKREIGILLGRNVRARTSRLRRRLGLATNEQLVIYVLQEGLLSLDSISIPKVHIRDGRHRVELLTPAVKYRQRGSYWYAYYWDGRKTVMKYIGKERRDLTLEEMGTPGRTLLTRDDIREIIVGTGRQAFFSDYISRCDGTTTTYVIVRFRRTQRSMGKLADIQTMTEAELKRYLREKFRGVQIREQKESAG